MVNVHLSLETGDLRGQELCAVRPSGVARAQHGVSTGVVSLGIRRFLLLSKPGEAQRSGLRSLRGVSEEAHVPPPLGRLTNTLSLPHITGEEPRAP